MPASSLISSKVHGLSRVPFFLAGANSSPKAREPQIRKGPGSPPRQVQRGAQEEEQGGRQVAHLPDVARYVAKIPARIVRLELELTDLCVDQVSSLSSSSVA